MPDIVSMGMLYIYLPMFLVHRGKQMYWFVWWIEVKLMYMNIYHHLS